MAWYCPSGSKPGINYGGAAAYTTAVKPDTCPKPCNDDLTTDRYSKCYNPKALKAHNAKRSAHKVRNLVLDIDVAKRAQALAESCANSGACTSSTEPCGVNVATASTTTEAADKDFATNQWYAKGTGYDWTKKPYSVPAEAFTNLIWSSSTKVGFGISGTRVVALYCAKGNVRGRFACNVCADNTGCDAAKCPVPDAICSSTDGAGSAEISLRKDKVSIRIIATVKKNQHFSLAFGKHSLVNSDLIVFEAKGTAATSKAYDSKATQANVQPSPEPQ